MTLKEAVQSIGADVSEYKSYVFVISVVIAVIAGSMYAYFSGLSPRMRAGI